MTRILNKGDAAMLGWAILFLIVSLVAGAFGMAGVSQFARRVSFILFGIFFVGFLLLLGFALLVSNALAGLSLGTDVLFVAAAAE